MLNSNSRQPGRRSGSMIAEYLHLRTCHNLLQAPPDMCHVGEHNAFVQDIVL